MPDSIPPDAETVIFFLDGSVWLAVRPGWQNVQSSPTGSGVTRSEAVEHLLAEERRPRFLRTAAESA